MGMSTWVRGFVPPDEAWQKMKAVWDACQAAGIDPPPEVEDFFDGKPPDLAGMEVDLPVREWNGHEMGAGYELEVSAIPAKVRVIRFWNSW
jgi:hypothetical protein